MNILIVCYILQKVIFLLVKSMMIIQTGQNITQIQRFQMLCQQSGSLGVTEIGSQLCDIHNERNQFKRVIELIFFKSHGNVAKRPVLKKQRRNDIGGI